MLVARGLIWVEAYSIALVCTVILEKLDFALPIFVFFCLSINVLFIIPLPIVQGCKIAPKNETVFFIFFFFCNYYSDMDDDISH